MKKKFITSLLLTGILVASLTGCAGSTSMEKVIGALGEVLMENNPSASRSMKQKSV